MNNSKKSRISCLVADGNSLRQLRPSQFRDRYRCGRLVPNFNQRAKARTAAHRTTKVLMLSLPFHSTGKVTGSFWPLSASCYGWLTTAGHSVRAAIKSPKAAMKNAAPTGPIMSNIRTQDQYSSSALMDAAYKDKAMPPTKAALAIAIPTWPPTYIRLFNKRVGVSPHFAQKAMRTAATNTSATIKPRP